MAGNWECSRAHEHLLFHRYLVLGFFNVSSLHKESRHLEKFSFKLSPYAQGWGL